MEVFLTVVVFFFVGMVPEYVNESRNNFQTPGCHKKTGQLFCCPEPLSLHSLKSTYFTESFSKFRETEFTQ
ncbi:MAG TPA: hypothetical protein VG603_07195, partial [Chitinophagales bacterium]|nr:hypothetical protein [Chitinophagales bacterium]